MDINSSNNASQYAPYPITGGRASPRKGKKTKGRSSPKKTKPKKIYIGPSNGKYYLRRGRKVYI